MDSINLLVSLDLNYLPQLQVLLTSIRLNCPGERFQIFLLHSGLPEYVLDSLSRWCADVSYGFTAIQAGEALFQNAPVSKRYPREMYYRLLASQLLPPGTDRTLYLDPDILVINRCARCGRRSSRAISLPLRHTPGKRSWPTM